MRPQLVFILFVSLCLGLLTGFAPAKAQTLDLPPGFTRELVTDKLVAPTAFVFAGDEILVAEKEGNIRVIQADDSLRTDAYIKLNVSTEIERGLLGIALHPKYPNQPYVFVYYTTGPGALNYGGTPVNRVSRLKTVNGYGTDEEILLDNIPSETAMHNAGDLEFGFDGKLLIAVGDSGNRENAADLQSLAGKILRLKANGKVPRDNPFFGKPRARPEVYAYGFRNPFRIAGRAKTQSFFAADVGWGDWEELDKLKAKGNFGWPQFEGPCPINTVCDPSATDFGKTVPPTFYYDSTVEQGNAIIGGVFAKGTNYPAPYQDGYFFGDIHGWVHVLKMNRKDRVTASYAFDTGVTPTQFRIGPDNNVYVLDLAGKLYRYVYAP